MRAESPISYKETFFVPEKARWAYIRDELHKNVGQGLNDALTAFEDSNKMLTDVLKHIDFNRQAGKNRIPDVKLRELIKHFNKFALRRTVNGDAVRASCPFW